MGRVFTALEARPGLETPQVYLQIVRAEDPPAWRGYMIRRGDVDTPVDAATGLLVTQGAAAELPIGVGDVHTEPGRVYHYALLAEVLRPREDTRLGRYVTRRLGTPESIYAESGDAVWWLTNELGKAHVRRYVLADQLCDTHYTLDVGEPARGLAYVGAYGDDTLLIALVTDTRYVELDPTGVVLREFALGGLSGNPDVRDAVWELDTGVRQHIAVLDGRGRRVLVYTSDGTIAETHLLTSLTPDTGDFVSLVWRESTAEFGVVQAGQVVFYDRTAAQAGATESDALGAVWTSAEPDAVSWTDGDDWFAAGLDVMVHHTGPSSTMEISHIGGWLARYVVDPTTLVLVRGLLTPNVANDTATVRSGVVAGTPRQSRTVGKLTQGGYVKLDTDLASWAATEGSVDCWACLDPSAVDLDAVMVLWAVEGSGGNRVECHRTTAGVIEVIAEFDGTEVTLSGAAILDAEYHHIAVTWTDSLIQLAVDGAVVEAASDADWAWQGTVDHGYIGTHRAGFLADPADRPTWRGSIDEFRVTSDVRVFATVRYDWTVEATASMRAGSAYTSDVYSHRDDLFTRLIPPYVQTRDVSTSIELTPETMLSNGEIVHRVTLADGRKRVLPRTHNERLWALIGALLDRLSDESDNLALARSPTHATPDDLVYLQGNFSPTSIIQCLSDPEYSALVNVSVRARVMRSAILLYQRKGTLDSLARIVRLLGYAVLMRESFPRRKLDSCRDPARTAVPFDDPDWGFDSGARTEFAARVDIRLFRIRGPLITGTDGHTVVDRQLTTASGGLAGLVRPGDMLRITGNGVADRGDYLITAVDDDTTLSVDRDWPVGGISGLTFAIHIWVPPADPISDVLVRYMSEFKSWGTALVLEPVRP